MEDVKKNIAALFNSRFTRRYLPRKKRPAFKGYVSLNLLDRPVDAQDNLQDEYIPLDFLEKPVLVQAEKNNDHAPLGVLDKSNKQKNEVPSDSARTHNYISVNILDKPLHVHSSEKAKDEHYISLRILDQPRKQKCEHLSPLMDCFAGGFGHIRCFDSDFHESCQFKLNHKKMLADREQVRSNLEKFG